MLTPFTDGGGGGRTSIEHNTVGLSQWYIHIGPDSYQTRMDWIMMSTQVFQDKVAVFGIK